MSSNNFFEVELKLCLLLIFASFTPPLARSQLSGKMDAKVDLIFYQNLDDDSPKLHYYLMDSSDRIQFKYYLGRKGWEKVELVCLVRGVFIFYEDLYYDGWTEKVQIFSGVNKCLSPANLYLGSLQDASANKYNPLETPYLSIFYEHSYSGEPYSVSEKSDRSISQVQPARSLITVGPADWTVTTIKDHTFCLKPFRQSEKDINVCLEPDLNHFLWSSFDTEEEIEEEERDGPHQRWKSVKRGCVKGVEERVIDTCFHYFSGEIQQPAIGPMLPTTMPPTEPIPETTSAPVTPVKPERNTTGANTPKPPGNDTGPTKPITDCSDAGDLAFLLRMRVTNDFSSNYQFLLPRDKKNSWRTELIDLSFDISISLTNQVLEPDFLPQVREFLIYFLEKLTWSNGTLHAKPSLDFKTITYQTKECLSQVTSNNLALTLKRKLALDITFPLEPNKIASDFERKPNLDLIMELSYLIFNMVSCTCHQVLAFQSNFWLDYITTIDTSYFIPMAQHWKKKSLISHHYSILLGGYDIKLQYDLLAATTTSLFRAMKYLEVYPRPQGL